MTWTQNNAVVATEQGSAIFTSATDAQLAVACVNDRENLVSDKRHANDRADQWEANYENLANSIPALIEVLADKLGFPEVEVVNPNEVGQHVLVKSNPAKGATWGFTDRTDAVEHAAMALAAVLTFDGRAGGTTATDPVLSYLDTLAGMDPDLTLASRIDEARRARRKELGR